MLVVKFTHEHVLETLASLRAFFDTTPPLLEVPSIVPYFHRTSVWSAKTVSRHTAIC